MLPGGQAGTAPCEEVVGCLSDTDQLAQLGGEGHGSDECAQDGQQDVDVGVQVIGVGDRSDRVDEDQDYVKNCFRMRLKDCAVTEKKFNCEDFEGPIYKQLCNDFKWSEVYEEKVKVSQEKFENEVVETKLKILNVFENY